jgi:hypothetical protein
MVKPLLTVVPVLACLAACAHDRHGARSESPATTAVAPPAASTPAAAVEQHAATPSVVPNSTPASQGAVNPGGAATATPAAPSALVPQGPSGPPAARPGSSAPGAASHPPGTSPAPAASPGPAKSPAAASSTAAVAASQPPRASASTAPALDLNGLEQRLRDTHAIGLFTKLSLKNQVDDLLAQFKAFHQGDSRSTLGQLRQRYELLLMKVVSLLQDGDPALASAVSSSREAIWGILTDPKKFAAI